MAAAKHEIQHQSEISDQFLIFRQGEKLIGLGISSIVEIIRLVAISPLPESSPDFAGVINYRGEIIPILNLWSLLGQTPPPLSLEMGIVILAFESTSFGVIAQEVLGVHDLEVKSRPDDLEDESILPLIDGVSYLDELSGLVLVLNPERLRSYRRDLQLPQEIS